MLAGWVLVVLNPYKYIASFCETSASIAKPDQTSVQVLRCLLIDFFNLNKNE